MLSFGTTGSYKMCGLNPREHWQKYTGYGLYCFPMFVHSQYLENCLHFPVWEKLLLPVLLDLRPIPDGSVCRWVERIFLLSNVILFTYQCITATWIILLLLLAINLSCINVFINTCILLLSVSIKILKNNRLFFTNSIALLCVLSTL